MFQIKVVEKIKTHILHIITFFRKSCGFWENVEKLGGAREAAQTAVWHRTAYVQPHARTHTHIQKYVIITAFPRQQWCLNTPQRYVLRTKPILFSHPTYRTCSLCYYQHHFDAVRIEYMTATNNLMTYLTLSMTEATCFASYQVKAPCILYSTVYIATIFSVNRDRIKMCYVRFVGSRSFIMRNWM
jgi:hypothetical protein